MGWDKMAQYRENEANFRSKCSKMLHVPFNPLDDRNLFFREFARFLFMNDTNLRVTGWHDSCIVAVMVDSGTRDDYIDRVGKI